MNDFVIRNALVVDGSGVSPSIGDVAVKGQRIAAVGGRGLRAASSVDGTGLVIAPGFVDIHTHYDAQLTWDPTATPSPQMGVTTVVIGNCGFGIAPCRPEHRDLTLRNLTKVEGMPLDALRNGVVWGFESFGGYLDNLEQNGAVPNVAALANHSCIRTYVMGTDAVRRAATTDEIERMAASLRDAMRAGAIGLGTSTLESHNGAGGVPMPSRLACEAEFRALAEVLGEFERGVLQITKGEKPSLEFIEHLAAVSGRPAQICPMLQDPGNPHHVFDSMRAYADAAERGLELYGQMSPFPEIMDFTLREPFPLEGLDTWSPAMAAEGDDALAAVYRKEAFRGRVKAELATRGAPFRFSNQWSSMRIKTPAGDTGRAVMGRSIAELAAIGGVHPLDYLLDLALADGLETEFTVGMFNADEDAVAELMRHEQSCIGLGDAGAHLSFFCQAGTGLYLLQRYVRERCDLTLEDAVMRLTNRPARAMRISERGRIAPGTFADLVLFDPETVGLGPRCMVDDLPGGLGRVHTPPTGVHGVWVNGCRVVENERLLGENRPGMMLRTFDA